MSSCEQGPQKYALLAALALLQPSLALLQSCNLMLRQLCQRLPMRWGPGSSARPRMHASPWCLP